MNGFFGLDCWYGFFKSAFGHLHRQSKPQILHTQKVIKAERMGTNLALKTQTKMQSDFKIDRQLHRLVWCLTRQFFNKVINTCI